MNLEEEVKRKLRYDSSSGELFWKYLENPLSKGDKIYNAKVAGSLAGWTNPQGYIKIYISKKSLLGHRVVWFLHHDRWPCRDLDHIDGNTSNNRIENLREVSKNDNLRNCKKRDDNTSGTTGVHYNKRQKQWTSYVILNGRKKHLGTFNSKNEAISARDSANKEHNFHENHGRKQP